MYIKIGSSEYGLWGKLRYGGVEGVRCRRIGVGGKARQEVGGLVEGEI